MNIPQITYEEAVTTTDGNPFRMLTLAEGKAMDERAAIYDQRAEAEGSSSWFALLYADFCRLTEVVGQLIYDRHELLGLLDEDDAEEEIAGLLADKERLEAENTRLDLEVKRYHRKLNDENERANVAAAARAILQERVTHLEEALGLAEVEADALRAAVTDLQQAVVEQRDLATQYQREAERQAAINERLYEAFKGAALDLEHARDKLASGVRA